MPFLQYKENYTVTFLYKKGFPENNVHPHETFSGGFFHNQTLKKIPELNLLAGCAGVEDSRNIVGLKLWADENGYGKMDYIIY